mmetsp:Transcript_36782/g.59434  ORF Transcript_36782/g.59434 Transcript_36782/m.59434 type:complete len:440 (-) Transcript_36782:2984-4303(-)
MGLLLLECPAQQYAWGKVGMKSTVAKIAHANGQSIAADKPYAEYWMGTHPNGPAVVKENKDDKGVELKQWMMENKSEISTDPSLCESYGEAGNLPYLFKILSVNTALSIQAHPNKKVAEKLHAENPAVYKDPNHKPEMACAVTPFEALAGFLKLKEIVENINATEELRDLLLENQAANDTWGDQEKLKTDCEDTQKKLLRVLFTSLMESDEQKVKSQVDKLVARLEKTDDLKMPNELALRLAKQYPGDVGVFCAYFMCYRKLAPGQAVFLGADEPHAYLAGDCAEIMATSDNVIRAGLTPKLRDVPTLTSILTYRQPGQKDALFVPGNLLEGKKTGQHSLVYSPPDEAVTEFQLERATLTKTDGMYKLENSSFLSIMLVLSGTGTVTCSSRSGTKKQKSSLEVKSGDTLLVPVSTTDLEVEATGDGELVVFRASLKGAF